MYMTQDEVRALSRRIPAIVHATSEELDFWMQDAFDVLNNFCQQDFVFESQTTKRVRATTNTLVYLPKVLSGNVRIVTDTGSTVFNSNNGLSARVELFPGNFVIGWYDNNRRYDSNRMYRTFDTRFVTDLYDNSRMYRSPDAQVLYVTGDWGFAPTTEDHLALGVNALRSAYEAHRQSTDVHIAADTVNTITEPEATIDLTSILDLINELRTDITSHFASVVAHNAADTNVPTEPAATDLNSAIALYTHLVSIFNDHLKRGKEASDPHTAVDEDNVVNASVDFDNTIMPRLIRRAFLRVVQRIAIRDDAEDHRQINSVYTNETLGDGYSYDLSSGTLRNLLRPEEAHMLLPYVNRGRVII